MEVVKYVNCNLQKIFQAKNNIEKKNIYKKKLKRK